ncbi:MAG TPA: beta-propeller domain-containing protein [Egibacteraceae bacterium]|nr:beta-propeller domain-containing protein [Egibacteraceae bacterium]
MHNAKVLAAAYVAVLAVSALVAGLAVPDAPMRMPDVELAAALTPFDECGDALAYFTETAAAQAATRDRRGGWFDQMAVEDAGEESASADGAARAAAPTAADAAGGEFSGTNVQEAGVDEPDLVKTDGRRIVTVAGGRLHVIDATAAPPRLVATLSLPGEAWGQELLLDGDRALVFSTTWSDRPLADTSRPAPGGSPQSVLTLVDLAETATPQVASTLTMEGEYVSARMVDGVARVVLRSFPGPVADLSMRGAPAGSGWAEEALADSTIADWVPSYRLEGATTVTEPLVDCERIHRPAEPAGTGLVTVLSVDLAGQLEPGAATSVVADAQTVYASAETLYVAFGRWGEAPESTEIHAFDITDPAAAVYRASGAVPGRLLNQWALSEHDGHLRVATTEGDTFAGDAMTIEPAPGVPGMPAPPPSAPSQSAVTVLAAQGAELVRVGRVEGLGPTERIYSVRFMGDVGYVVTFRETDPLYTLDLSDPANPRVVGELKILGYSAYLHPVGDGLLLGVGQDATEEGRVLGTQLSLFDVSDLARPTRVHQTTLPGGHSSVESDHRAFLHWPPTGTIVLPLEIYPVEPMPEPLMEGDGSVNVERAVTAGDVFAGAVAFTVDPASGFTEIGRLSHASSAADPWMSGIRRSLVVGDTLYTVSEVGVQAADLATLAERAFVALPGGQGR